MDKGGKSYGLQDKCRGESRMPPRNSFPASTSIRKGRGASALDLLGLPMGRSERFPLPNSRVNSSVAVGYTEQGTKNNPAARLAVYEVYTHMKSLFERLRTRRLASMFILLATLSAGIVAGSYVAHGVRGQEKQNDSADATPLKVVDSPVPPNEFVKIAKDGGAGGGEHQYPDAAQAVVQ